MFSPDSYAKLMATAKAILILKFLHGNGDGKHKEPRPFVSSWGMQNRSKTTWLFRYQPKNIMQVKKKKSENKENVKFQENRK